MVDTRPRVARFSPDGTRLWVTAEVRGTVMAIDVASSRVTHRIDVAAALADEPIVQPFGVAITGDGGRVFVGLGRASHVVEIDPQSMRIVRFFRVGMRAWNVALSRDETRLYTANGLSGDVSVIDIRRNEVIATISTGGRPWDVVVGP